MVVRRIGIQGVGGAGAIPAASPAGAGGGAAVMGCPYVQLVLADGATYYWRLNEPAGLVAADSADANPGTYVGVTLGQPGVMCGDTSPWFDGLNDYVNVLPMNAWNGNEGSAEIWVRVNGAGVWTDGVFRYCFMFQTDGNNYTRILKSNANNTLIWTHMAGGVSTQRTQAGYASVDWMQLALTWSLSGNQVRTFYNGAEVGAPMAGQGAWAGVLVTAAIGSGPVPPSALWHGWEAHASVYCGTVLTPPQVLNHYNVGIAS